RRSSSDQVTVVSRTQPSVAAWIRLERSGPVFTASVSDDGDNWTVVGADTIPIAGPIQAGLSVAAGNYFFSSALITDLQVVPIVPPPAPVVVPVVPPDPPPPAPPVVVPSLPPAPVVVPSLPPDSPPAPFVVPVLPAGWGATDIGPTSKAGSVSFDGVAFLAASSAK